MTLSIRMIFYCSLLLIASQGHAGREIDPVPMRLLDLVFGPGSEKTRFYQDVPESFPKFELASDL